MPEGLLRLGDILDEYITLKKQKTIMEREKKKHKVLVQGIQDSLLLYASDSIVGAPIRLPHSSSSIPIPSPLSHHFSLPAPPGRMLMPLSTPSPISKRSDDFSDAVASSSSPQGKSYAPFLYGLFCGDCSYVICRLYDATHIFK